MWAIMNSCCDVRSIHLHGSQHCGGLLLVPTFACEGLPRGVNVTVGILRGPGGVLSLAQPIWPLVIPFPPLPFPTLPFPALPLIPHTHTHTPPPPCQRAMQVSLDSRGRAAGAYTSCCRCVSSCRLAASLGKSPSPAPPPSCQPKENSPTTKIKKQTCTHTSTHTHTECN